MNDETEDDEFLEALLEAMNTPISDDYEPGTWGCRFTIPIPEQSQYGLLYIPDGLEFND